MPAPQRLRCDEEAGPTVAWEHAADGGEQGAVGGFQLGAGGLPLEDGELVAQHQDLQVLGGVTAKEECEELKGACGCRKLVHLRRPGCIGGSAHRDDRPVEPAHWLLEGVAGRLPAAVPGRVPGGGDAGCSAPHSSTARSADVVDLGAASGPAAHDGPCRPTARRRRSGCPHWRPQDRDALGAKLASKVSVNLASRSRSRNLNCSMRSARSMRRLRACWATHSPVGLAVTPRM
jgi:hypothetical protein